MSTSQPTATEKLFLVEARLTYKLSKPLPKEAQASLRCKIKRAKYLEFIREICQVENIIDNLELDDDQIFFLSESSFYKKLECKTEHSFLFDGDFVKLVGLYTNSYFSPSSVIVWCKKIKSIH